MDLPICGYSDRLSAHHGETIAFKVSSRSSGPYAARLLRVIHVDPNPAGPGMRYEDLGHVFSGRFPSVHKPLRPGSYARVTGAPRIPTRREFAAGATIFPTALARGEQSVLSQGGPTGTGFRLLVGALGTTAIVDDTRAHHPVPLGQRWQRVAVMAHADRIVLQIDGVEVASAVRLSSDIPATAGDAPDILIGAASADDGPSLFFNGRIEAPFVEIAGEAFASWDFALGIGTMDIIDRGSHALHGALINLPTRAVRSSGWDGSETCWRAAPAQYAAIHFHDDDLHDAGWATDFTFTVPDTLRSGAYAMEVTCDRGDGVGTGRDWLPFYVSASPGRPAAPIVFVAPTYTYQAYANFARGNFDPALKQRVADFGAYPHNPDEHPDVGLSTYNLHSDGSGVMFSSRLRPMLTVRPGFMTFNDPHGSGCRHYTADSHLLDWLEHEGFAFDVVTDDDLERHGSGILASYPVVLTGTHPEYHTANTLDAFAGYLDGGGNLAYLGGNGFYWRVGLSDAVHGALEVRRAGGGTRAWAPDPGEEFHAFDGRMAGLWRNSDRAPNKLVGIGFTSQGNFEGSYYRVAEGAHGRPGGWIVAGLGETFGRFGLNGGGAAGFELDSVCYADGSPRRFTLLARSEGHGPAFGPALDALLSHTMTRDRGDPATLIRSEMIFYDTPSGGSVFSIGSITFCSALSHDAYVNDVSALMRNYLSGVAGRKVVA